MTARRLHDTDRSGWWQLIVSPGLAILWLRDEADEGLRLFLFVATWLVLMVLLLWMVRDSDPCENRW